MNSSRRHFLPILITILLFQGCSNEGERPYLNTQQIDHLTTYCKVWGFLKYYHPAVAKYLIDWDSVFITDYPKIKDAASNAEFNTILLALIKGSNKLEQPIAVFKNRSSGASHTINVDFSWFGDSILTHPVSYLLNEIKENYTPLGNHYVASVPYARNPELIGDNAFFDSLDAAEPIRVLALARYWNIINYFYPYKNVLGYNWDSTLSIFLPQMISCKTATEYQLTTLKLCNTINDSHSRTESQFISDYFGHSFLPLVVKYLEKKTVIIGADPWLISDTTSFLDAHKIHKGDILLAINGVDVAKRRDSLYKFVPGSNEAAKQRNINQLLLRSTATGKTTLLLDNGISQREVEIEYIRNATPMYFLPERFTPSWKLFKNNIGYINLGSLQKNEVENAIEALKNTRGILFDIRYYPSGTALELMRLLSPRLIFELFQDPDVSYPGYLFYDKDSIVGGEKALYKGKIVILVNEMTQSQAEELTMALQSIMGSKTFGSQTAGADGNVSKVYLPGGITTQFSGRANFYPDGTPTQRIGIKIDQEVKLTLNAIREDRDEILEEAIQYIDGSKK